MTMAEAITRFVPDGSTVAIGTSLEPLIPFAAGHEMIRQQRQDLELVGPISDALFDQLIGAGCVRRVTAAWVGNVSEGLGHCYRRACEQAIPRALEVHDHSNFSISLALWAAAWNVPNLPTRTLLGSDILHTNPNLSVGFGLVHVGAVVSRDQGGRGRTRAGRRAPIAGAGIFQARPPVLSRLRGAIAHRGWLRGLVEELGPRRAGSDQLSQARRCGDVADPSSRVLSTGRLRR